MLHSMKLAAGASVRTPPECIYLGCAMPVLRSSTLRPRNVRAEPSSPHDLDIGMFKFFLGLR